MLGPIELDYALLLAVALFVVGVLVWKWYDSYFYHKDISPEAAAKRTNDLLNWLRQGQFEPRDNIHWLAEQFRQHFGIDATEPLATDIPQPSEDIATRPHP